MGTISISLPSDSTIADVADYNNPITTIVDEINGNLDNANISSSAAIAGSKLANSSVTSSKIDFGGTGAGIWWQEIGRTTLSSDSDTISITGITAKKYIQVYVSALATGGTIRCLVRFNNDSGNNYAHRFTANNAADATGGSQSAGLPSTAAAQNQQLIFDLQNIATAAKLCNFNLTFEGTSGAANVPNYNAGVFKWHNTSDQVTRVDIINDGTGNFASGSEVVVLGHN